MSDPGTPTQTESAGIRKAIAELRDRTRRELPDPEELELARQLHRAFDARARSGISADRDGWLSVARFVLRQYGTPEG
jgi:hypothetical protein